MTEHSRESLGCEREPPRLPDDVVVEIRKKLEALDRRMPDYKLGALLDGKHEYWNRWHPEWHQVGNDADWAMLALAVRHVTDDDDTAVSYMLHHAPDFNRALLLHAREFVEGDSPGRFRDPRWVREKLGLAVKFNEEQRERELERQGRGYVGPRVRAARAVLRDCAAFDEADPSEVPGLLKARAQRLFTIDELSKRVGRFEMLVDGLLPAKGLAQFYGDEESGKSTALVSLALHVVKGAPSWCGRELRRGPARVAYISGEATPGLVNRFRAGARALDVDGDAMRDRLVVSDVSGALTEPQDVERWNAELDWLAVESELPVALIVVDTQLRNFGPGNENAAEDMSRFLAGAQRLADRHRALVVLVHHTGHARKDSGRGSSAQGGALDASVRVTRPKNKGPVTLSPGKTKDFMPGPPLRGAIVGRALDDTGRETAAVFEHTPFDELDQADDEVRAETERRTDELVRLAVEVVRKDGGAPSRETIAKQLGVNLVRARAAVDEAVERGALRRRHLTAGRRGYTAPPEVEG